MGFGGCVSFVYAFGFRVWGLAVVFRVSGSGFRVLGLGFRGFRA